VKNTADNVLILMILTLPDKAWKIAGLATVASVVGGFFGYGIGVFFFDLIAKLFLVLLIDGFVAIKYL